MQAPVLLTASTPEWFRSLAAIEPRYPDGNADARADCDVVAWSPAGQPPPALRVCGPLSVHAVWHGVESYSIGRRSLCVDEDTYLVINRGHEYQTHVQRRDAAESLTVFFSGAGRRAREGVSEVDLFAEHLRPHDGLVTPLLSRLIEARRAGVTDTGWYAEQLQMLYANLVAADDALHRKAAVFEPASLPTRTELFRRVMTATDYVNSNYMGEVTLDDMASAAHLSKFHLARLFRALHGVSPAVYLRLKRLRAAERLLERSDADLAEIAERAGFGSRWSMFRELRRRRGMSGQRIRDAWMRSTADTMSSIG